MASDELFRELAKALGQPSRAYRAAATGLEIPNQAIGGYLQGTQVADVLQKRKAAQQTLRQLGVVPTGLESLSDLPLSQAEPAAKIISAGADLEKARTKDISDMLTPDQARAYGVDEPVISSFGGRPIPRQVAQGRVSGLHQKQIGEALAGRTAVQKERLDFDQRNIISKQVNGLLASGSNNLGRLFQNNIRSFRALKILDKPGPLSKQEYDLVTSDLSGIIQGGAPLRDTLGEQRFNTLMGDIASRVGYLKSEPAQIDTPEVRAILKKNITDIVHADNASIDNNFSSVEAGQKPFIDRNQQWFEGLKSSIKQGLRPEYIEQASNAQQTPEDDLASALASMSREDLEKIAGQ